MTRTIIFSVTTILLLISLTNCFAAVGEPNEQKDIEAQSTGTAPVARRPRPRADIVTMAEFYLRDGNAVSGRLLSEDNTQIVIEQPSDGTLVTKTFSKRELDARTLKTRPVPESQYYTRVAEYFAARTWDFRDDPDDFIAAIRSYERAKQLLRSGGADEERIAGIDSAIKRIEEDREVWTKEVESRAKLKKLEYEAEAENRLKQLEKQVAESNVRLNESIKYLDKTAADIKNDYERLEKTVTGLNRDFVKQLNDIQVRLTNDEIALNEIWVRLQFVGRP